MTVDLYGGDTAMLTDVGETLTYRPRAGGTRSITGIIERDPPETLPQSPRGIAESMTIHVVNSATTGISSGEIDTGGDKIDVPVRFGETAKTRTIIGFEHDAGMLRLEVR